MNRTALALAASGCLALASPCLALGSLTTLYIFKGQPDAFNPAANIAIDAAGDIFGGSEAGGRQNQGAIFELTPPGSGQTWTETVLKSFPGGASGTGLNGGVLRDRHGALYSPAVGGAAQGCGSVSELRGSAGGYKARTIWVFAGGTTDGCQPSATLTMDAQGALYGNTFTGGANNQGAVFKLTPPAAPGAPWTESVIWSFDGVTDGSTPDAQMIFDSAGNLFGTSFRGGPAGVGTVWRLTPPAEEGGAWTRTVLWSFSGPDGNAPTRGPLVLLADGSLIGTCHAGGAGDYGVVFRLTPPAQGQTTWTESTIWSFAGGAAGGQPTSGVARASKGELIVVTSENSGNIFELLPPGRRGPNWTEKVLWQFSGSDGSDPEMTPVLLPHGVMEGTTRSGGSAGAGTAWRLAW